LFHMVFLRAGSTALFNGVDTSETGVPLALLLSKAHLRLTRRGRSAGAVACDGPCGRPSQHMRKGLSL
jgi:hypothetical protein